MHVVRSTDPMAGWPDMALQRIGRGA
jgi:hypothetical protein